MATQEQIDKLPAWAQNHIRKLASDLKDKEAEIMALQSGTDTLITYNNYVGSPRGLPNRESVRFYPTEADKRAENYIEVEIRGGEVQVRSNHYLSIMPRATNSIAVKAIK